MPLKPPSLDDRSYEDLRQMALEHIRTQLNADWTDLSPGDPGILLLEAFAYLTDQLIYRLNRVPQEKVYVALLRLLGISLYPPVAARVELAFTRLDDEELVIPAFTRVTTGESQEGQPDFTTAQEVRFPARRQEGDETVPETLTTTAYHCTYVRNEVLGTATGDYGAGFSVAHAPIIAPTDDTLDLEVEVLTGDRWVTWQEEANFSNLPPDSRVYVADRAAGQLRFAPAAQMSEEEGGLDQVIRPLAAAPPQGATIRVAYAYGGGAEGNVAADVLRTIVPAANLPADIARRVTVTNPGPAIGGKATESLTNALVRGPQEIYSLERAITARDFERVCVRPGTGIARAAAYSQVERWVHGRRGTVEIRLVPEAPHTNAGVEEVVDEKRALGVRAPELGALATALESSQPLGMGVNLKWADFKRVWVEAVVDLRTADHERVLQALQEKLARYIDPLSIDPTAGRWMRPFSQPLYTSDIHRMILDHPDVETVTGLSLCVDDAPDAMVRALAADRYQPHTWYAGSGRKLFRSFNDGEGWERAAAFPPAAADAEESIALVKPSPTHPGLVAVWVHQRTAGGVRRSVPYISTDCGESWHRLASFGGTVEDTDWLDRGQVPILLMATETGLHKLELSLEPGKAPTGRYIPVPEMPHPLYAVAVVAKGTQIYVAVARRSRGGVYLANGIYLAYDIDPHWDETELQELSADQPDDQGLFRPLERTVDGQLSTLRGEDIRRLAVQGGPDDDAVYLWAGAMSTGWEEDKESYGDDGVGCFFWEVMTPQPLRGIWRKPGGWRGGSCRGLAFMGAQVVAVSQWGGVLRLGMDAPDESIPRWQQTNSVALPRREVDVDKNFVRLLAVDARDGAEPIAMAGGPQGVYGTRDGGITFSESSRRRYDYKVTLPPHWLFVSGEHRIRATTEQ